MRAMTLGLGLLLLLLAACGRRDAPPPRYEPDKPEITIEALRARSDELGARCDRHAGDRAACNADWACMEGPPRKSCSGRMCTQGGPPTCVPCLTVLELQPRFPAEVCALRAGGRTVEACRLAQPDHPERCDATGSAAP
jgi:hypothetical protein